jgi:hypothetical protein
MPVSAGATMQRRDQQQLVGDVQAVDKYHSACDQGCCCHAHSCLWVDINAWRASARLLGGLLCWGSWQAVNTSGGCYCGRRPPGILPSSHAAWVLVKQDLPEHQCAARWQQTGGFQALAMEGVCALLRWDEPRHGWVSCTRRCSFSDHLQRCLLHVCNVNVAYTRRTLSH